MNTLRNRIRSFAALVPFAFLACGGEGGGPLYVPPSAVTDAALDVAVETGSLDASSPSDAATEPTAEAAPNTDVSDAAVEDGAVDGPPADAAAPDGG